MFSSKANFSTAFDRALGERRIVPHFQPIVSLRDEKAVGFEVLARWHDPQMGAISPSIFIPLVEESNALDTLMDALMREAFVSARGWPEHLFLAFNVSPSQLRSAALPNRIANLARDYAFPISRIHLEVTETAVLQDPKRAAAMLQQLIDMGCKIAVDDFGTGFSSLTWLRSLPFTKIKIDTSFVGAMLEEKESRKIVNAVVGLGHSLGSSVVAEGVETLEQVALLRRMGCGHAQGYFFGKAVAAQDVPAQLRTLRHREFAGSLATMSLEQRAYQVSTLYEWDDVGIGFVGTDEIIVDANNSFARHLGQSRQDLIGCPIRDLAPPELSAAPSFTNDSEQGRRYTPVEVSMPSGRTVLFVLHDIYDEASEQIGRSILAIDVTDRKRAEAALQDERQQFQFVLESCPHIFWSADADGRVRYVNPDWYKISGMSYEDMMPGRIRDYIDPQHRDIVMERWRHCLSTGETYDIDYRHRLADGKMHWTRCWGTPRRDADGQIEGWYGTLTILSPPREPE